MADNEQGGQGPAAEGLLANVAKTLGSAAGKLVHAVEDVAGVHPDAAAAQAPPAEAPQMPAPSAEAAPAPAPQADTPAATVAKTVGSAVGKLAQTVESVTGAPPSAAPVAPPAAPKAAPVAKKAPKEKKAPVVETKPVPENLYQAVLIGSGPFLISKPKRSRNKQHQATARSPQRGARK